MVHGYIRDVKREDDILHLELQLAEPRPSSSGKMHLVFSTGGFQIITEGSEQNPPLRANVTVGFYPNPKPTRA